MSLKPVLPTFVKAFLCAFLFFQTIIASSQNDESIAEFWNEATLKAISRDFARPTVHARNLFHTSIAMYDAWAAFDPSTETYLLGRTRGTYTSAYNGIDIPATAEEIEQAREIAMSFAAYRLINHRFQSSPGAFLTQMDLNQRMTELGLDRFNTSTDYVNGGAAELGNYIASQVINFGITDGANESGGFANQVYQPSNPNILPEIPGTNGIIDPNRWQAISLSVQIDQSGNAVSNPPFLSPEWGNVFSFSMTEANKSVVERDGINWPVYFDPGMPALLDTTSTEGIESFWKWNFCLVSLWQAQLDPNDPTMIDISPNTIGNSSPYPQTPEEYFNFYDFTNGGTADFGHNINPITGQPYPSQIVKRGDYARVVAEFWADGPQSTTPPGHWFEIYNEIRHHPLWENKWMGEGPELNNLEYDAKAYLTLGGALHDAAITAWSIKGAYDFVRPVSAVRYMCEKGQCTNAAAPNYHPAGMPLIPGFIENVEAGDPLAGPNNEHVNKIKLYTWKGPDYIANPHTDYAGVDWILGEKWWPYQRPSFVTPPFAGYISGHSTFSRTAAEVLTAMTGSAYFPGGVSNFPAPKDDFLEFEIGPSDSLFLQWATYRDASDQCSLSRIWGGIHPPVDDIPGRLIGMQLGPQAFSYADDIFRIDRPSVMSIDVDLPVVNRDNIGAQFAAVINFDRPMNTSVIPVVSFAVNDPLQLGALSVQEAGWISQQQYRILYSVLDFETELESINMRVALARDAHGVWQNVFLKNRPFVIDTKRPQLLASTVNNTLLNDDSAVEDGLILSITFSEPCNTEIDPSLDFASSEDLSGVLLHNVDASGWISTSVYQAHYTLIDNNEQIDDISVVISGVHDKANNAMLDVATASLFSIDTRNPLVLDVLSSAPVLNVLSAGGNAISITATFDKEMNTAGAANFHFPNDNPLGVALVLNSFSSGWTDAHTYVATYNQVASQVEFSNISVELVDFQDLAGNRPETVHFTDLFMIDTKRPEITSISQNGVVIADSNAELGQFEVDILFSEDMNVADLLLVQLTGAAGISPSLTYNPFQSSWTSSNTYNAVFNVSDQNVEIDGINLQVSFGSDLAGNTQVGLNLPNWISIDTKNPEVAVLFANVYTISDAQVGEGGFSILSLFSEAMNTSLTPNFDFSADSDPSVILSFNENLSGWQNNFTYHAFFDVSDQEAFISAIALELNNARDIAGNDVIPSNNPDFFSIGIGTLSSGSGIEMNEVRLFPNPVKSGDAIVLEVSKAMQNVQFSIWSVGGKLVSNTLIPNMYEGRHQITPPALATGIYFAVLQSEDATVNFKVVVLE